ncbi:MAG: hypothetical protein CMH57_04020 [Myxococcales bacterium]|nr:hypothetical protein [Myxococcales bacterium]
MKLFLSRAALALTAFAAATALIAMDANEAHAQKRKGKVKKLRPMGGVRGGFILTGSGDAEVEAGGQTASASYDDNSTYALNGFAAWPVAKNIRVGGSIWWLPSLDLRDADAPEPDEKGMEFDVNLLAEYVMPFGSVDGFAYGEGGLSIMLPPDDGDGDSSNDPDNGFGYNVGGGAGAQFLVSSSLALRGDLRLQYYSVDFTNDVAGTEVTTTFAGTRVMLNVGVAFGL